MHPFRLLLSLVALFVIPVNSTILSFPAIGTLVPILISVTFAM